MILLASGDFAGQKEILNKIVAYHCIVFLRNVTPLFCDDPPVSVV